MNQTAPVRHVDWFQLAPWLLLFRVFSVAISFRVLFLATAGALASWAGIWLLDRAFGEPFSAQPAQSVQPSFPSPQNLPPTVPGMSPSENSSNMQPQGTPSPRVPAKLESSSANNFNAHSQDSPPVSASSPWVAGTRRWFSWYKPPKDAWQVVEPLVDVSQWYALVWGVWHGWLDVQTSWKKTLHWVLLSLWLLAIWSVVGGTIQRIAVARLGRQVWLGPRVALRHVLRKWLSYIGAPLLPMVALSVGLGCLALAGWVTRISLGINAGLGLVALFWPLVLVGSFLWTLLFLGLAFGWPLMWANLGAEQDADAWDAIARGYACTLQRPFRYATYLLLATVLGLLGWLLVYHVGGLTLYVSEQGVLRAAGTEADTLRNAVFIEPGGKTPWIGWLIVSCNFLVSSVVYAFGYGYFFVAAAALYLLLRRDTTQTPIDEVFLGEDDESMRLPPLPTAPAAGGGSQ